MVDLDTFHRFGEQCAVYDLRRDAKSDPVRTECLFVARATDHNWLYHNRGTRHMCGDIVVEVATGKVHYTAKAHFNSCAPLDSNVYNVTIPVDYASPFQPSPLPTLTSANDSVVSLTGAPTTTRQTGESVLSDLNFTDVPKLPTSLPQTGESFLPDLEPMNIDAVPIPTQRTGESASPGMPTTAKSTLNHTSMHANTPEMSPIPKVSKDADTLADDTVPRHVRRSHRLLKPKV